MSEAEGSEAADKKAALRRNKYEKTALT